MEKLHLLHSLLASLTCMSSANQYSLRTIDSAWIRPNISFVPVRSITACILKYNLQLRAGGESNVAGWDESTSTCLVGTVDKSQGQSGMELVASLSKGELH